MDGLILLQKAADARLKVYQEGSLLKVSGQKGAEAIALQLIENKEAVLEALNGWDAETALLVRWFINEGQHLLPDEPFELYSSTEVENIEKFRKWMLLDISQGPGGPRNINGVLKEDLIQLKELFGENHDREDT